MAVPLSGDAIGREQPAQRREPAAPLEAIAAERGPAFWDSRKGERISNAFTGQHRGAHKRGRCPVNLKPQLATSVAKAPEGEEWLARDWKVRRLSPLCPDR